jgi:hypothetical protein
VKVGIALRADERHSRCHPEDVPLERQTRCGKADWAGAADEVGDRRIPEWEQPWPILKRLHLPAFDPASQRFRESEMTSVRGRGNPRREYRECDNEEDDENALG